MDVPVNLAGLELEHPLMNGAGSCKTLEEVELLSRSGLAAIMVGSATLQKEEGNEGNPFYYEPGLGSLNSIGLKNPGLEYYRRYLPDMIEIAHGTGKLLFFSGAGTTPDDFAVLAMLAQEAKVDLFEANFGCPNKWYRADVGVPERMICFDGASRRACLRAINNHYQRPLSVKVSIYTDWFELHGAARDIQDYDVQAVTVCNTFPHAFLFRPGTNRPVVVPQFKGLAGYGGEGIRPIAMGQIIHWREALNYRIAIIGVGGISQGRHVQEFIWCGATAVQIVTPLLKKNELDPSVVGPILSDWSDLQDA